MKPDVAVLLSTYNGERFLVKLLESILVNQKYKNFILIVRDDGSVDNTVQILQEFARKHSNVVVISGANIGPLLSFGELLTTALERDYQYFLFADQDDIWFQDKICKAIERLKELEGPHSDPALVHTDLNVVDEEGQLLDPSFWHYQSLNPKNTQLNRLLIQNVVTGCTVAINRRLAEMAVPFPKNAIMHDWWLALVASAFGSINHLSETTIDYRQHSQNTVGARKFTPALWWAKFTTQTNLDKYIKQAKAFKERYESCMSDEQILLCNSFVQTQNVSRMKAIHRIIKYSFLKSGFIRNVGFLLKILMKKRM